MLNPGEQGTQSLHYTIRETFPALAENKRTAGQAQFFCKRTVIFAVRAAIIFHFCQAIAN
jgi:hypothetical protein